MCAAWAKSLLWKPQKHRAKSAGGYHTPNQPPQPRNYLIPLSQTAQVALAGPTVACFGGYLLPMRDMPVTRVRWFAGKRCD